MNTVPEASPPEANRSPRETIRKLLESLYDRSWALEAEGRLRDLMDRCVPDSGASTREAAPEWISQRDVLLITAENGDVALVDPVPAGRRELTRFPAVSGKTWNPPALAGDLLLVRNDEEAACYRLPVAR